MSKVVTELGAMQVIEVIPSYVLEFLNALPSQRVQLAGIKLGNCEDEYLHEERQIARAWDLGGVYWKKPLESSGYIKFRLHWISLEFYNDWKRPPEFGFDLLRRRFLSQSAPEKRRRSEEDGRTRLKKFQVPPPRPPAKVRGPI